MRSCIQDLACIAHGQPFARVWHGEISEGMTLNGERVSSVNRVLGQKLEKQARAGFGEIVAIGRLEGARTGSMLSPSGKTSGNDWPEPLKPMFSVAVQVRERTDEVKLSGALARLADEDPHFLLVTIRTQASSCSGPGRDADLDCLGSTS